MAVIISLLLLVIAFIVHKTYIAVCELDDSVREFTDEIITIKTRK
jgi:hypothetical protein